MKCQRDLLELYIDNRLPEAENMNIEAHLRRCPKCREDLDQLQLVVSTLQACKPPDPDENFITEIIAAIEAEPSPLELELQKRRQFGRLLGWGSSILAVGLLAVLLVVFRVYILDGLWTGTLWLSTMITSLLPQVDIFSIWQGIREWGGIFSALLQGNQFLLPVLVILSLLAVTMAKDIVDDVQRVLGYRE